MSLIQRALERTSSSIYQAATEKTQLPKEEKVALQKLEEKIAAIEKKTVQAHRVPWIFVAVMVGALLGGLSWVYFFNAKAAQKADSSTVVIKPPSPFRSFLSSGESTKLSLTGITMSGGYSYALINNQVVAVGDKIRKVDAVVREILPKSAVVERNGKLITLVLE